MLPKNKIDNITQQQKKEDPCVSHTSYLKILINWKWYQSFVGL